MYIDVINSTTAFRGTYASAARTRKKIEDLFALLMRIPPSMERPRPRGWPPHPESTEDLLRSSDCASRPPPSPPSPVSK
jgi:hypothetical protein